MDLKNLLLTSLSSGKILYGDKRLHIGNNVFVIRYEVKGTQLFIKKIKKYKKSIPLEQRIQRRKRFLKQILTFSRKGQINLRPISDLQPLDRGDNVSLKTVATQTVKAKYKNKTEEEHCVEKIDQQQQTKRKIFRRQATQTISLMDTHSVQTEDKIYKTRANQVKWITATTMTQTSVETSNVQMQTELQDSYDHLRVERETLIYLLNEIGEMIINQNHLLHNNSTLLGQISDMTMLTKMADRQTATRRYLRKIDKQRKARWKFIRHRGKYRYLYTTRKTATISRNHRYSQTDVHLGICFANKSTQTERHLGRRLNFFSRLLCHKI